MIRLLSIEFKKLFNSKYFWVLSALFTLFLIAVPIVINIFVGEIEKSQMAPQGKILVQQFSLFYFKDIWQNLTYIYKLGTVMLAFIVVISITTEYNYKTIKQNIIDGLSKKEFILSKIYMILSISIIVTISVGIIGLVSGFFWSKIVNFNIIVENIYFLGFYFLYIFNFLLFSLVIGMLIKKSGIAIAFIIFYVALIEPILSGISTYLLKIEWLSSFFPMNGTLKLIPDPFSRVLLKTTTEMDSLPIFVTIFYIIFYIFISYTLIKKRDL